jgi:hypothetical protein
MGRNERLNMNAIRHLEDSLTEYAEGQALKAPGLASKEKLESIRENIRAGVSAWMEQGAAKFGGLKEMVKSKGKTLEFFEWMNQAVRQKIAGKTSSARLAASRPAGNSVVGVPGAPLAGGSGGPFWRVRAWPWSCAGPIFPVQSSGN